MKNTVRKSNCRLKCGNCESVILIAYLVKYLVRTIPAAVYVTKEENENTRERNFGGLIWAVGITNAAVACVSAKKRWIISEVEAVSIYVMWFRVV